MDAQGCEEPLPPQMPSMRPRHGWALRSRATVMLAQFQHTLCSNPDTALQVEEEFCKCKATCAYLYCFHGLLNQIFSQIYSSHVVHDNDSICLSPIALELNRKSGDLKVHFAQSLVGRDKQVEGKGCTWGRQRERSCSPRTVHPWMIVTVQQHARKQQVRGRQPWCLQTHKGTQLGGVNPSITILNNCFSTSIYISSTAETIRPPL